jgi:hypothetical protein
MFIILSHDHAAHDVILPSNFGHAVKLVFVVQILPDFGNPDSYAFVDD